ncbi:MAG TPA: YegS/Rv2252/BmrU family lipid kinase [Kiloniellales bacterium]
MGAQGRTLLIIRNPAAGRCGGRFAVTLRRLHALGCRTEVRETTAPGDAEAWAREAAAADFDLVVAAGGDGTIREVINGLAGLAQAPPLAVLPLGTANVLAIEIGLPADPAALADVIAAGTARPICLGRIRDQAGRSTLFTAMAGVGFDAQVVAGVSLGLKRILGKGAYVAESLRQLGAFRFPRYRAVIDGRSYEAASVIVANGRHYAGRYVCAPPATIADPTLYVCLFESSGALAVMRYMVALQAGRLAERPDYRIVPARRVAITASAGEPVQADGDIVARLPVEIDGMADALRLVMPSVAV